MSLLITLVVVILVVGFAVWLIDFLPVDARFKSIAKGVIVFAVVLWLLLALLRGGPPALPALR